MSTPFDPQPGSVATIVPATAGQLRYLADLVADRDMAGQGDKYIARASAVRMAIRWATDINGRPERASELVAGIRDAGEAVNKILATVGAEATDETYLWAPVTRSGASTMIDWLTTLPRKDRVEQVKLSMSEALPETGATYSSEMPSATVVPAGRYAVATEDGAVNELAFYKVDRPTEGKWAGYVFVKHIVGGDEQRMSFAASKTILAKIAAVGAAEASAAYGHHIGECGVCGRTLTNDESRARGIGPKCAANQGW